ncbi:MAG: hypothetical protein WC026_16070 [Hyphomicrobium sp.]|uniref:hypothetical protein n=1 Tax=Hyphomicrobium sp. TaxID=82 RepID=UPI003566063E
MSKETFSREKPKTVAELIAELSKLDPNMRVMVQGYESGLHDCDVPEIRTAEVNANPDEDWFFGPHNELFDGQKRTENSIDVVLIGRYCCKD